MKYQVIVEQYYNDEFSFRLHEGEILRDGDLESDLTANLVANGVLAPEIRDESSKKPKAKPKEQE